MRIIFLVNSFPSSKLPANGIFNLRAANQLSQLCNLKIITIRSWFPGRPFREIYEYLGHTVLCLYLPGFPNAKHSFVFRFNDFARSFLGYLLLPGEYKQEINLIHSVQFSSVGPIGISWARKLNSASVVQCIGSDINVDVKLMGKRYSEKIANSIDGLIFNSIDLQIKVLSLIRNGIYNSVIYRGFKMSSINKDSINKDSNLTTFLYLGGFPSYPINKKGGVTLLRAIELVQTRLGDENVKFIIGGKNSLSEKFDKWKADLLKSDLVEFIGELEPETVLKIMRKSDVLIIPSIAEGLPNTLIEAAAHGITSIASKVGGIPEVIDHKEDGILIDPGSVGDLSKAIIWCTKNKDLIKKFGKKLNKKVRSEFEGSNYGERLMQFYEEFKTHDKKK